MFTLWRFHKRERGYSGRTMTYTPAENFPELLESMKRAAATLRDAGAPYMLGGGLAAWARGGPPTEHDVDFFVRPEHAEQALDALVAAGMTAERPPEGWLLKAWDGEVLIDLIFHPLALCIDDAVMRRADRMNVCSMPVSVMSLEDVIATKLMSLNEHYLDYAPLLAIARGVREQVDWPEVAERTAESPYARPFFVLLRELGVVDETARSQVA